MKLMLKLILLTNLALLSGCAGSLKWVGDAYDRADPCQSRAELNRPANYQTPEWCGASSRRTVIYNTRNQPVGYIR